MWGTVLKRDLLGEIREEDRFHSKKELREYLEAEIYKQGENVVIRNLDVSLVEDLSELFRGIGWDIKTLDLSGWKTSNVKNMTDMFYQCESLKSLDVTGWDTSNVENMGGMFWGCHNLESLDISNWNTSNVKSMCMMLWGCKKLEALDLSGWDTSNVKNMSGMFYDCRRLKALDLSGWDTSNIKDMSWTFYECSAPYEVVDNKIVKII